MKKIILGFILTFYVLINQSFAQSDISMLRFSDDNSAIKADTSDWKVHRAIKEIELGSNDAPILSIGGDVRMQARQINNPNFGDDGSEKSYTNQRLLLHTDLKINNTFRVFAQIGSMHTQGKDFYTPDIDVDKLSVRQAFVDFNFKSEADFLLRAGRQELSYGDSRIISFREGPNIRLSYDGLKFSIQKDNLQGDFFVVRPMINNTDIFDNKTSDKELIYSTYWTINFYNDVKFDLYYFGDEKKDVFYFDYSNKDDEKRHSLGFRVDKSNTSFFYNTEFTYQFGNFGNDNISAFQEITQLGYQFNEVKSTPAFKIQGFIHSGDRVQNDGTINTFRTISSKPPTGNKFTFGPANAIILMPEIDVSPTKALTLIARYMWVWKYSANDVLYTSSMSSIIMSGTAKDGIPEKVVAKGFELNASYVVNKHLLFDVQGGTFTPCDYTKAACAGENLSCLYFNCSYKF